LNVTERAELSQSEQQNRKNSPADYLHTKNKTAISSYNRNTGKLLTKG